MSAKACFPCALVMTVLGLGTAPVAYAQAPASGPSSPGRPETLLNYPRVLVSPSEGPTAAPQFAVEGGPGWPGAPAMADAPGMARAPDDMAPAAAPLWDGGNPAAAGLSGWIRYNRPCCCGPIGGSGPIYTELFARTGPAFTVGGGVFNQILDTGWKTDAGGRSYFFNPELTAAWTVELSLGYVYNHGQSDKTIPLTVLNDRFGTFSQVTVTTLHRSYFTGTFGKEWYLYVWPGECSPAWRAGFDVGARLGSVRADFRDLKHHTDVIYSVITSIHTDLEIPRGCCTYLIGVRAEWDHDWMDVLQSQNNSNLQDVNVLLNLGVRF